MFKMEFFIIGFTFLSVVSLVVSMSQFLTISSSTRIVNAVSHLISKLRLSRYRERLRSDLVSAGIHIQAEPESSRAAESFVGFAFTPDSFLSVQILLVVILFAVVSLAASRISVWSLVAAYLGFYIPGALLKQRVAGRHREMRRELPYFVDLLALSVEAGLDFNSSLNSILDKIETGALRDEFSTMLRETRMGKTRRQAMEDMRKRVRLPELSSLMGALIQADTYGTGLGRMLHIQSEELRRKRSEMAEKLAMEAPVKMLFPLIGFIFPAVFIIVLGPIFLQLLSGKF